MVLWQGRNVQQEKTGAKKNKKKFKKTDGENVNAGVLESPLLMLSSQGRFCLVPQPKLTS